jgi:hypothetical protein
MFFNDELEFFDQPDHFITSLSGNRLLVHVPNPGRSTPLGSIELETDFRSQGEQATVREFYTYLRGSFKLLANIADVAGKHPKDTPSLIKPPANDGIPAAVSNPCAIEVERETLFTLIWHVTLEEFVSELCHGREVIGSQRPKQSLHSPIGDDSVDGIGRGEE